MKSKRFDKSRGKSDVVTNKGILGVDPSSGDEREIKKVKKDNGGVDRGSAPCAKSADGKGAVDLESGLADKKQGGLGVFDAFGVKPEAIRATVESVVKAADGYTLRVSVCPMACGKGYIQRAVVVTIRFQRPILNQDCWCIKSSHLIDAIHSVRAMIPGMGWPEFFTNLREYSMREVSQGPNIPLTRVYKGSRYETRVMAGFVYIKDCADIKEEISSIGSRLSDFLRSKLFRDVYLSVLQENAKETVGEGGRQGMYGAIKDPDYFVWEALRSHTLEIRYDEPLDTFYLDATIMEMLSRMYPGCDLDNQFIRAVGYKYPDTDSRRTE